MHARSPRKLSLKRETVRELSDQAARRVAGGTYSAYCGPTADTYCNPNGSQTCACTQGGSCGCNVTVVTCFDCGTRLPASDLEC